MAVPSRFLLLLPLAFGFSGCGEKSATPEQKEASAQPAAPAENPAASRLDRSHAGSPAPRIAFQNPGGDPASLGDFGGKPLLLNLWATWCAPCVAEMPTLDAVAGREDGKLQVLALSQDTDGRAKVDAFFAERKLSNLQPYIDPELALMEALKVDTLPTTIMFDANGREVWRMIGVENWAGPRAAELIAEAR